MTNCNDKMLIALLETKDGADGDDTAAAKHLETCDSCQLRITQLAADQDSWHAAADALNDQPPNTKTSVVIAVDRGLASDMPVQVEHISLDFLEEPSHPEMLGRIGRYDVERLIGAGGMGIVMKAYDTELHRPVAVKALAPHLAHSGGARQRFSREAQSAAAVVHENVVPIHNVDVDGKLPFLVMQYVDGESLQSRVERTGSLSPDEVLRLGKQIAMGLAAAHAEGLVHRDVKPGNILLEQSVDRVLITDFGLARAADDASMTRSGVIAGTPHYMSPEQARGESIDIRSDLFGVGSVLYFMCTGHPPFRADGAMAIMHRICSDPHRPVDQVNEDVPADLAELIDQLLCKDSSKRPKDAQTVADTLTSLLLDKRSKTRFRKRKRKRKTMSKLMLIASSCFLALTAFCIWWGVNQMQKANSPVNLSHGGIRTADEPTPVEAFDFMEPFDVTPKRASRFDNSVRDSDPTRAIPQPQFSNPRFGSTQIRPRTQSSTTFQAQDFNATPSVPTRPASNTAAKLACTWPSGGGKITITPIGGAVQLPGIEFIAEPGILTQGTSPVPFTFFIPNGARPGNVTFGSLHPPITIDAPLELDVSVSAFATNGDIRANWGNGTTCTVLAEQIGDQPRFSDQMDDLRVPPRFGERPRGIQIQPPAPIPLFADVNFDMELEDLKTLITELENRQ